MSIVFGLDFGTSNSALSVNDNGHVTLLDIDPFNRGGKTLKSVLYYDEEDRRFAIGQEAVDLYVENDACGRYIQSVKSFLPDASFEKTEVGRKNWRLEELIAKILKEIKARGEKMIGKKADRLVLGRPVVFSETAECEALATKRLLEAARLAGFDDVTLQYEPLAAALAFESNLAEGERKLVLVGDFGGGTSDFTLIRARGGDQTGRDRKEDVLAVGGVYIGGDTFDSALMWHKVADHYGRSVRVKAIYDDFTMPVPSTILGKLKNWHQIPQLKHPKIRKSLKEIKHRADRRDLIENLEGLIDDNYGYMLFQAIEKAKCALSENETTTITFDDGSIDLAEPVSRKEFDGFIQPDVEKIRACVEDVINRSGVDVEAIDTVFLTGGSSNILAVQQLFIDMFGEEKLDRTDVFTSVAFGLGVSGSQNVKGCAA